MKHKIILGTVQLGIPYGINNSLGKPSKEDAFSILNFAYDNNINYLDTADGYGDALQLIGQYQEETSRRFRIINKFKIDEQEFTEKLTRGLKTLSSDSLYCYMYHHFPDYELKKCKEQIEFLKKEGLIEKAGVSLYSNSQLKGVVEDTQIDIIQLPINLFDLNQEKIQLLKIAKSNGKEVHARSVYLQGLFLKDPVTLTGNLSQMKPYLEKLHMKSSNDQTLIKKAALNFVLLKEYVDFVVLGIDRVAQLEENLSLIDNNFEAALFDNIEIGDADIALLNPANWKA